MDPQSLIVIIIAFLTISLIIFCPSTKRPIPSPPGPSLLSFLLALVVHPTRSQLIAHLHAVHGPILALRLPFLTVILATKTVHARQTIVRHGSSASDMFPTNTRLLPLDYTCINFAPSDGAWHLLRHNLESGILGPSSIRSFREARGRARQELLRAVRAEAAMSGKVRIGEMFGRAVLRLLGVMCFGAEFGEEEVELVKSTLNEEIVVAARAVPLASLPVALQWCLSQTGSLEGVEKSRERRHTSFLPLLRARQQKPASTGLLPICYMDSLLELRIEGRKLTEEEIVALCSEFVGASTHTTTITMQWIIAELINRPKVQQTLAEELDEGIINDEGILLKLPLLRAVISEVLRCHPAVEYNIRHIANEVEMGGYVIPKGALVLFDMVAMGADAAEWERPKEFRPERFLAGDGDGKGEQRKLMTFGAGKRVCPGVNLSMLLLCSFVADLVKEFEWSAVEDGGVDLSHNYAHGFLRMKKEPLIARASKRISK